MNTLLNGLTNASNFALTENNGLTHKSTRNMVYDMFALGGAYRTRSDEDTILLFKNAYEQDPSLALKCLFYLRDVRGGAGERRFFRVCYKWLAKNHTEAARRNMPHLGEYGRWDDYYVLVDTPLENAMFTFLKKQLALDVQSKTPSLLAKWLKSCNTSSAESRVLGDKTRIAFGMTHKQYRKTLSILRERINIVERLMSENRWDEIEFDKIPSRAGLIYKNAFARRDIIAAKYEAFAKDENTKVNAKALYPYEVVNEACKGISYWGGYKNTLSDVDRAMVNKYWDNLTDYFNGASLNALAVVDTSGSMTGIDASAPINVAISLGMYCAEKAKGPFAGHYISFSRNARLVKVEGVDFVDKVQRIYATNLCENTNLQSVFDLLLQTAINNNCSQADLPEHIIIISDMEIDNSYDMGYDRDRNKILTMMETQRVKWANHGYELPNLIYWNVQARNNNILDDGPNVSYVSGMSPVLFEQIMTGKTGVDLMLDKLNSERYAPIH